MADPYTCRYVLEANLLDKRNVEVIQAAEMADPYANGYVLEERLGMNIDRRTCITC